MRPQNPQSAAHLLCRALKRTIICCGNFTFEVTNGHVSDILGEYIRAQHGVAEYKKAFEEAKLAMEMGYCDEEVLLFPSPVKNDQLEQSPWWREWDEARQQWISTHNRLGAA